MKYFINTSILFLLSTTFLQAQEVNGTDLKNLSATYIAAEYQPKTLLSSSYLLIDYGQIPPFTIGKKLKQIAGVMEDGRLKEFNSEIEALNFLADYGYKLSRTYQNLTTDVYDNVQTGNRTFLMEKVEIKKATP